MVEIIKKAGRHVIYKQFPNLVTGVHLFWVFFIPSSTIYTFFSKPYIITHLKLISISPVLLLLLGFCPLTKIEEKLRSQIDPNFTYNNNFTTFYINRIFRKNFSTKQINKAIALIYTFSYLSSVAILLFR